MSRTTDKYIKIRKEADKAPENEIRIRADARIGRYISYAATLLLEKKLDTVILKASGVATRSAVQIAEILRHRILNLHQLTQLKTISVLDEYEPREEGLDRVSIERHLAVLEITLSLKDGVLDTKQAGYQQPLPKEEVQEEDLKSLTERRRPVGREGGAPRGDDRREGGERRGYGGRGGRGFGGRGRGGRGFGGRGGRGFGGRGRGGRNDREDREEGRGYGGRGEGRGYGDRREGGYNDRREGGYNDRREGGYNDRREGGYGGDRREGGYNDRREGGYGGDRREGGERRGYGSRGGRGYGGRGGSRGYDNERSGGDNRRTRGGERRE